MYPNSWLFRQGFTCNVLYPTILTQALISRNAVLPLYPLHNTLPCALRSAVLNWGKWEHPEESSPYPGMGVHPLFHLPLATV